MVVYDVERNAWRDAAPMHTARKYSCVRGCCGSVYAISGMNDDHDAVASVERWDPASNTWAAVASMPGLCRSGNLKLSLSPVYDGICS